MINSQNWVNEKSKTKFLGLNNNRMKALSKYISIQSADILGGQFRCSIQLENIEHYVEFGITDVSNLGKALFDENFLCIDSDGLLKTDILNNQVYRQLENKDIITMLGDITDERIAFFVNGKKVCDIKNSCLMSKSLDLCFYLYLNCGSEVCLLESFSDIGVIMIDMVDNWYDWDEDVLYEVKALLEYDCFQ